MDTVKQLQEIKKKQLKKLNANSNDLDSPLASGQNSPGTLTETIYLKKYVNCQSIIKTIRPRFYLSGM